MATISTIFVKVSFDSSGAELASLSPNPTRHQRPKRSKVKGVPKEVPISRWWKCCNDEFHLVPVNVTSLSSFEVSIFSETSPVTSHSSYHIILVYALWKRYSIKLLQLFTGIFLVLFMLIEIYSIGNNTKFPRFWRSEQKFCGF